MREQLTHYVELLFAGTTDTYDIQQEILQNTLDKYDDLIEQGKSPEAAYRLAISGIGDINEILGSPTPQPQPSPAQPEPESSSNKKLLRAIAIGIYILCPVPLFLGIGTLGLCEMFLLIAIATVMIVYCGKGNATAQNVKPEPIVPDKQQKQPYRGIIWGVGIALYIILSFLTNAWHITWILFPMLACIQALINAILDLRETNNHEN